MLGGSVIEAITFCIGFVFIAIVVEILLVAIISDGFNVRLVPRGLGWIVVPIIFGIGGWRFGRHWGVRSVIEQFDLDTASSKAKRLWVVGTCLWALTIIFVFLIFDPFDEYRWSGSEWIKFLLIVVGPPILAIVGIVGFRWALKDRDSQ